MLYLPDGLENDIYFVNSCTSSFKEWHMLKQSISSPLIDTRAHKNKIYTQTLKNSRLDPPPAVSLLKQGSAIGGANL